MDFIHIQQDEKFHAIPETHLATLFKQYAEYMEKNYDVVKSMQVAHEIQSTKSAHKCAYFCVKNFINERNDMKVCGAAAIFSAITMSDFKIATEIIGKRHVTKLG